MPTYRLELLLRVSIPATDDGDAARQAGALAEQLPHLLRVCPFPLTVALQREITVRVRKVVAEKKAEAE